MDDCDRRLSLLLERCQECVALADETGKLLVNWSPRAAEELGYRSDELLGASLFDYVHPDDLPAARDVLAKVLEQPGQSATVAVRVRHKDGSWRWLEGTLTNLIHEPLIGGILINWRDVTRRRQAEKAASAGEDLLARIFEDAPVGMAFADLNRRIIRVNRRFAGALGYEPEELVGRHGNELIHPDDVAWINERVPAARAGGPPLVRADLRFIAKDGRLVWMDFAGSYLRDDEGRPRFAVAIFLDVTEKKQAMAELEESRARIRQMAEFVVQAREQERASIAREIHDELAQMLTGLGLQVEALAADHDPDCPQFVRFQDRIRCFRELLRESVQWAKRMSVELRPGVLDHLGLAEAIRWQVQRFQHETGVPCRLRLPDGNLELDGSQATTVFRILQEALSNVARHSRASRVEIRLRMDGGRVVLSVKDNGAGLPPLEQAGPLAVGLIGMKERAELHGGRLRFFSRPGQGTVASLRLPVNTPPSLDLSEEI